MTTRTQTHSRFEPPATAPAPVSVASEPARPADGLRAAAVVTLAAAAFGLIAREVVARTGLGHPQPASANVFFALYTLHEGPFLWLLALSAVGVWIAGGRMPSGRLGWELRALSVATRTPAWAVALAALALTLAGGAVLLHGIDLAMDEFTASFQARIFASGRVQAPVPAEWRGLAPWMTPVFVNYKEAAGVWLSSYLPVYAAIRSLFLLGGVASLTNPALGALTIVLVVAVGRRIWSGDMAARPTTFALLFLALSAQFLVTSMGAYSMAAHLCLNLLWLWLYLRNDRVGLGLAPWIGVLALGLHNPIPHTLFAAPFVLRLVRERRFGWVGYCALVYAAGAAGWYQWLEFAQTDVDGTMAVIGAGTAGGGGLGGGVFNTFGLPSLFRWFVQGMSLVLLLTWQTPAVAPLLVVAFFGWRRLGATERDLAAGLVATWLFYAFFDADQGHGWGYRYMHPVLGNVVLLAAAGAEQVWRAGREAVLARLIVASAVATLAVQWPLRAVQTERFVRPYAAVLDQVARQRAEIVAVDPGLAWYGRDFVRNDPFLETTPKVVGLRLIGGRLPDPAHIPPAARGRIHRLTTAEIARLGVPVFSRPPR